MSKLRQKQIEELTKAAKEVLEDDTVSAEEFATFTKAIVKFLTELRGDVTEILKVKDEMLRQIDGAQKVNSAFPSYKRIVDEAVSRVNERIATVKDGYTPKKGIDYNDGIDGADVDPHEVAKIVLASLSDRGMTEENMEKVEKLMKKLDDHEKNMLARQSVMPMIGSPSGRSIFKEVDLSASLDGVTKTFNIGAFYRILTVDLSSFPHALRKTTDYTYDGNAGTITFTDEIDAATSLATGQTCIITLVTA